MGSPPSPRIATAPSVARSPKCTRHATRRDLAFLPVHDQKGISGEQVRKFRLREAVVTRWWVLSRSRNSGTERPQEGAATPSPLRRCYGSGRNAVTASTRAMRSGKLQTRFSYFGLTLAATLTANVTASVSPSSATGLSFTRDDSLPPGSGWYRGNGLPEASRNC